MGLILVISGAGICTASSIDDASIGDEIDVAELEKPDVIPNGNSLSDSQRVRERRSRISFRPSIWYGVITFVQSCIAIAFYSGLAVDYRSNVSMQQWVQVVFPAGRYLLSWEAVLFVSAVFGLVMTQFAPGRAFAD